jgi:hypothetical protein
MGEMSSGQECLCFHGALMRNICQAYSTTEAGYRQRLGPDYPRWVVGCML